MILGDLFGDRVVDAAGHRVGFVTDARFLQDRGAPLTEVRLFGLIVSPRSRISSLGYERRGVRGPAPIAGWIRRRHRGTFLVRWEDVARVEDGVVRLRPGFSRYSPLLPEA
jgi:sporulation protein YlmC with PRC-barrel domain